VIKNISCEMGFFFFLGKGEGGDSIGKGEGEGGDSPWERGREGIHGDGERGFHLVTSV
jgi:hypothetical protein